MPFRSPSDVTAFDTNVVEPFQAPQELIDGPGVLETAWEGLRLSNFIYAGWDILTRERFAPDPEFDFPARLRKSPLGKDYAHQFVGVNSDEEFTYVESRIQDQIKRRQIAGDSWVGIAAEMLGGVIDPTILLPGVAAYKAGRGFVTGAGLVGAGATIQESGLLLSQETRTYEEAGFNIAASAVLGGILGAAAGQLNKRQLNAIIREMEEQTAEGVIAQADAFPLTAQPTPLGSEAVSVADAGKLKTAAGTERPLAQIGPVTRQLNSDFTSARTFMARLETAGTFLENNIQGVAAAPGGAVAQRATTHYAGLGKSIEELDRLYAQYWFGGSGDEIFGRVRARTGSNFAQIAGRSGGKLTAHEFREAVADAMNAADVHPIPEVAEAASVFREKLYDPTYEAAVEAGLFTGLEELPGSVSYLNRIYNEQKIIAEYDIVRGVLANNYMVKTQANFLERLDKLRESEAKAIQEAQDITRPAEEAAQIRTQLREELTALEEAAPEQVELADVISELRSTARDLPKETFTKIDPETGQTVREPARGDVLREARERAKEGGEPFAEFKKKRAAIKKRLANLNKTNEALSTRRAKIVSQIEEIEERNIRALQTLINKAQRAEKRLARISDAKLDGELSKLKTQFAELLARFDKGEDQIRRIQDDLVDDPNIDNRLLAKDIIQQKRTKKLDDLAEKIEELDSFDRVSARALIRDTVENAKSRLNELNVKRHHRQARLRQRLDKLDPEIIAARATDLRNRAAQRRLDFAERMRLSGADTVDLDNAVADFSKHAEELADETLDVILGNSNQRLPGIDAIQGKRGPELARVLDIPYDQIRPWLEKDIERLSRSYTRTIAPDIEMARMFDGSVTATGEFQKLLDEFKVKREAIGASDLDEGGKRKAFEKLQRDYDNSRRDLLAVIGRLRHNYALPENPQGLGHRAANIALQLNYLRYMGMVTISSFSDVHRAAGRYGLNNTFKYAVIPMVKNFKAVRLQGKIVKQTGTALDMTMDTRQQALADIFLDWQRGTKFERSLEYLSNNLGFVSLMAPWNATIKQLTGGVAMQKMFDDIEAVVRGAAKPEQIEFLAANNINFEFAERIWKQLNEPGAGAKIDDSWLPNLERWTDRDAKTAFQSAIVRETDAAIITPGAERPLWQSSLLGSPDLGRLIGQFRSFSTASIPRMILSGLQQRDMAVLNGLLLSFALGGLSYYTWAVSTGGDAYQEMLDASTAKWINEMVDRSGYLSVAADLNRVLERTPYGGLNRLTGQELTRHQATDVFGAILGPSADLASKSARVLTTLGEPTQSTTRNARRLLPYQNAFYLRQLFDAAEDGFNESLGIPETRR